MATFQSRDELTRAYESLVKLEKKMSTLLEEDELDVDPLSDILDKQSEIMSKIDESSSLDDKVLSDPGSTASKLFEKFTELRDQNRTLMEQRAEEIESLIDSLDQAHDLLKHYLQGEPRSGEKSMRRIDEEA